MVKLNQHLNKHQFPKKRHTWEKKIGSCKSRRVGYSEVRETGCFKQARTKIVMSSGMHTQCCLERYRGGVEVAEI